jgi:hypothetical protein
MDIVIARCAFCIDTCTALRSVHTALAGSARGAGEQSPKKLFILSLQGIASELLVPRNDHKLEKQL